MKKKKLYILKLYKLIYIKNCLVRESSKVQILHTSVIIEKNN